MFSTKALVWNPYFCFFSKQRRASLRYLPSRAPFYGILEPWAYARASQPPPTDGVRTAGINITRVPRWQKSLRVDSKLRCIPCDGLRWPAAWRTRKIDACITPKRIDDFAWENTKLRAAGANEPLVFSDDDRSTTKYTGICDSYPPDLSLRGFIDHSFRGAPVKSGVPT